ncbi:MAG: YihY/virulence factor BrkB family protein [Desulfohalobiaceae bacterium]|nr:YihY/virulence factor BrkB family protein [Desulfohalobiaceae bacterium]
MSYVATGRKLLHGARFIYSSFQADQCLLRAAALTYATSLSIVPLLAVAFSILKGFGFQNSQYMRDFLFNISAGKETIVEYIVDYINQTNVSTLGVVGVVILLVTVFTMLSAVERSFNSVWGVESQRKPSRMFADYLSVTLVTPLLIVVAISFSASLESLELMQWLLSLSVINYAYIVALKLMPYALVCFALFFLYKVVPNTQTDTRSCLLGGVSAGLLWQILQSVFLNYQIGVSKYNAIYGSFAQLPLFLIWLYLSWIVVLLGAEISFCLEQRKYGLAHSSLGRFNISSKERLAMALMALLSGSFVSGRGPVRPSELALRLDIPLKPVNQILGALADMGAVSRTEEEGRQGYVPAISPESTSCAAFLDWFRSHSEKNAFQFDPGPEPIDRVLRDPEHAKQSLSELAAEMEGAQESEPRSSMA